MKSVLTIITSVLLALGTFAGVQHYEAPKQATVFGNFNPTGGSTYRLQSSIGLSDTSLTLTSFKEPTSGIPYTMSYLNSSIEYATLDPQSSSKEFVSFSGITENSDGSATLTGVIRGLGFSYPYTASSTLIQPHSAQSILILSNPPQLYNQYGGLSNANTWSGINTFSSTSPPRYDTDPVWANFSTQVLADVAYVNSVVSAGAANASETVKGIVQLATGLQAASSTSLGSTGARLALGSNLATDTPNTLTKGSRVLMSSTNGFLNDGWLDIFGINNTWTGGNQFASTTATATSTFNGGLSGIYDYQVFTANGTWTKPANLTGTERVYVQVWGGGGGGASGVNSGSTAYGGGGGGGSYEESNFRVSDLTSTVTVTVGAAAAAATTGNNTTFGSYITAYGGGKSPATVSNSCSGGGGGGGGLGAGGDGTENATCASAAGGGGGGPLGGAVNSDSSFGGGGGGTQQAGGNSGYGGGGGGGGGSSIRNGGSTMYGGGGGGNGSQSGAGIGGASTNGGLGGAGCTTATTCTATAGTAPAGGGGGCSLQSGVTGTCTGGGGARGEVRVWVIR